MEGLVFPSKFYSICAASRPVLLIGDDQSELAGIIRKSECGQCFSIGKTRQIVDYLVECTLGAEQLSTQGQNARQLFKQSYMLEHAIDKWNRVLAQPRAC
jgi:hypothetical protein